MSGSLLMELSDLAIDKGKPTNIIQWAQKIACLKIPVCRNSKWNDC